MGNHCFPNVPGAAIGNDWLESVADLDPQQAVFDREQQQRATVLLVADAPALGENIGEIFQGFVAERINDGHGDLGAGLLFQLGSERVELPD